MEEKLNDLEVLTGKILSLLEIVISQEDSSVQKTNHLILKAMYTKEFNDIQMRIIPKRMTLDEDTKMRLSAIKDLQDHMTKKESNLTITKVRPAKKFIEVPEPIDEMASAKREMFETEMVSIDIPTETAIENISTDDMLDAQIINMLGGKYDSTEEKIEPEEEEMEEESESSEEVPVKKPVKKIKKKVIKKKPPPKKKVPTKVVPKETREERVRRKLNSAPAETVRDIGKQLKIRPAQGTTKLSKAHVVNTIMDRPKLFTRTLELLG